MGSEMCIRDRQERHAFSVVNRKEDLPGGPVGRVERSQRTELAIAHRGFWAVDVDDITDEDR